MVLLKAETSHFSTMRFWSTHSQQVLPKLAVKCEIKKAKNAIFGNFQICEDT